MLAAVQRHLASYGPASRHDVAWWSGLGLRQVDVLLEQLDLTWHDGPDGRAYADVPGSPAAREVPGVRLLPEFDALLCGYDPRARDRFVAPADNDVLWHRANGLMLAPVLVDGRIGGYWRLEGTGRARTLAVSSFPGRVASGRPRSTRLPRRSCSPSSCPWTASPRPDSEVQTRTMDPGHTLILLRHAKSDWSTGDPDHERPLAARGVRQAPEAGRWLAAHLDRIDLAVVSTAERARRTWSLVSAELGAVPPVGSTRRSTAPRAARSCGWPRPARGPRHRRDGRPQPRP